MDRVLRSRNRGIALWAKLRNIGARQAAERLHLNKMWDEAEAEEAAMVRAASLQQAEDTNSPGFITEASIFISTLPIFFWRAGKSRELGYGTKAAVRGVTGFIMVQSDAFLEEGKTVPRVVRLGRRAKVEPMIISAGAMVVPAVVLLLKGRGFLSAMHTVALIASALHHIDGENCFWLHMVHLCPLLFTLPSLVITFLASALPFQAAALPGMAACVWLYLATGHPGTYSYEKYHLLFHWAWMYTHLVCTVSIAYIR